jgi:hypothetical protein
VKSEGAMGAVVMAVCWASDLVEGPLAESRARVAWWLCGCSRLMLLLWRRPYQLVAVDLGC